MSGMNTLGSTGVSDYQNRTVTIEVAGVCQQSVLKTSNYQVRVPYSQMSEAMQAINRQGGKVASVQIMGNPPIYAADAAGAESEEAPSEDNPSEASPSEDSKGSKKSRRKRR